MAEDAKVHFTKRQKATEKKTTTEEGNGGCVIPTTRAVSSFDRPIFPVSGDEKSGIHEHSRTSGVGSPSLLTTH